MFPVAVVDDVMVELELEPVAAAVAGLAAAPPAAVAVEVVTVVDCNHYDIADCCSPVVAVPVAGMCSAVPAAAVLLEVVGVEL